MKTYAVLLYLNLNKYERILFGSIYIRKDCCEILLSESKISFLKSILNESRISELQKFIIFVKDIKLSEIQLLPSKNDGILDFIRIPNTYESTEDMKKDLFL